MANTISPNISSITTALREAIETMPAPTAPFSNFARLMPGDPERPMDTAEVPNVTATGALQTDPTDWQSGDSTIGVLTATPHQYSVSYHVRHIDLQKGLTLQHLARSHMETFVQGLMAVPLAILTSGNYGTALTSAASAFGPGDIPTLVAAVRSPRRFLLLDTAYFAKLCPGTLQAGPLALAGFPNGVYEVGDWSAAGAGVVGAVGDPNGMVIIATLPKTPAFNANTVTTAAIPGLGINCQINTWIDPGVRTLWVSYDLVLSAAVGKAASLKLIKSS
jgi:hypothetical protein